MSDPAVPRDDAQLVAALGDFVPRVMQLENMPGMAVAVALDGEVIWQEGFGDADLESKIPMTAETVLRSGSMGKTYTATSVMQLVESGRVLLSEPAQTYLDFPFDNPLGDRPVTVHDLLTHAAGLTTNSAGSTFDIPGPLAEHLAERFASGRTEQDMPLWSGPPGERFQYSNLGTAVLGRIVERANADALDFSEYVQRNLIEPLGMQSTQFAQAQAEGVARADLLERVSTGYARFGPVRIPTPRICFGDYPAGTVLTTVGDHIRVLLAYLNGGEYRGRRILQPDTVEQMISPQRPIMPGIDVGIMWHLRSVGEETFSFGHGGAHMYGWESDYRAYPALNLAVVTAANEWPMLKPRYWGHTLVNEFTTSWLRNEARRGFARPVMPWAWKVSYIIGARMAGGLVSLHPGDVTPQLVDGMASGVQLENGAESLWDETGFRCGAEDLLSAAKDWQAVAEFFVSDSCRVGPIEGEVIVRLLGGAPTLALPLRPD